MIITCHPAGSLACVHAHWLYRPVQPPVPTVTYNCHAIIQDLLITSVAEAHLEDKASHKR